MKKNDTLTELDHRLNSAFIMSAFVHLILVQITLLYLKGNAFYFLPFAVVGLLVVR